jgi:hypothetical protein
MKDLGFEKVAYHVLDEGKSNDFEKIWIAEEGWFQGEELQKKKDSEVAYQAYIADPAVLLNKQMRETVAASVNMTADQFYAAFTEHYAIFMEKNDRFAFKLAFDHYSEILEYLVDEFFAYFEPYKDIVQLKPLDPNRKVIFVLFANKKSYMEHSGAREEFAGHYSLGSKMLYTFKGDNKDEVQTIFHEGVHQLIDVCGVTYDMPGMAVQGSVYPWFNEGIAEFFGSVKRDGEKYILGAPNTMRLFSWQNALKFDKDKEISIDKVINISYPDMQADWDHKSEYVYSGGWSLCYFLLTFEDGKYKRDFMRFINSSLQCKGRPSDFKAAFSNHDLAAMNKEWRKYIKKLDPSGKDRSEDTGE